ncbi:MAG: hypothetical protein J6N76_09205 [Lachnospiraceae bacterium]|nr:hypothetical protein [Lachnospiraceae bacterium]
MSIRPVDFNGMLQTTSEVANTKAQENQKPQLTQDQVVITVQQETEAAARQVQGRGQAAEQDFDFSGEGNSKGWDGNKNRKKSQKKKKVPGDGVVRLKKEHGSFDFTI